MRGRNAALISSPALMNVALFVTVSIQLQPQTQDIHKRRN